MTRRQRSCRGARWALALLIVLLGVGHGCVLAAAAPPGPSTDHHPDDHPAGGHEHDADVACDPVDAVSRTGQGQGVERPLGAVVVEVPPAATAVSGRPTPRPVESWSGRPGQPPLFLLFASLLI